MKYMKKQVRYTLIKLGGEKGTATYMLIDARPSLWHLCYLGRTIAVGLRICFRVREDGWLFGIFFVQERVVESTKEHVSTLSPCQNTCYRF